MSEIMTNSHLIVSGGIPRKKKVVICGSSIHTAHEVRSFYQRDDWEIWGLNQMYKMMGEQFPDKVATRWFQIHHDYVVGRFDPFQKDLFRKFHIPIYMIDRCPDIPYSVPYPIKEILAQGYHEQYFSNIISYMLALAIYENMEEIYLTGCDMAYNEEYSFQRPGVEFFIGYAKGRGIKVGLPGGSALLKTRLYGYESNDNAQKFCKKHMDFQENELRKLLAQKEKKHAALWRFRGAKDAAIELGADDNKKKDVQEQIDRIERDMHVIGAAERETTGMIKAFSIIQQVFYGVPLWDSLTIEKDKEKLSDE